MQLLQTIEGQPGVWDLLYYVPESESIHYGKKHAGSGIYAKIWNPAKHRRTQLYKLSGELGYVVCAEFEDTTKYRFYGPGIHPVYHGAILADHQTLQRHTETLRDNLMERLYQWLFLFPRSPYPEYKEKALLNDVFDLSNCMFDYVYDTRNTLTSFHLVYVPGSDIVTIKTIHDKHSIRLNELSKIGGIIRRDYKEFQNAQARTS